MTWRIPFPIPEPDRSALIAAGRKAIVASNESESAHRSAQIEVRKVIAIIEKRYGMECEK